MQKEIEEKLADYIKENIPEASSVSYVDAQEIDQGWVVEVSIAGEKLKEPRTLRFFVTHQGDVTPGRIQGSN